MSTPVALARTVLAKAATTTPTAPLILVTISTVVGSFPTARYRIG